MQSRLRDAWEGEGGRYGESNMDAYITMCNIDSQWEFAI